RVMMVNHIWEYLRLPDFRTVPFGGEEKVDTQLHIHGAEHLLEFKLELGLPVWRYEVEGFELEKRIYFAYRHNTVFVRYRLTKGSGPARLKVKPSLHFRGHDDPVNTALCAPVVLTAVEDRYELSCGDVWPVLRTTLEGGGNDAFTIRGERISDV